MKKISHLSHITFGASSKMYLILLIRLRLSKPAN